MVAGSKVIPKHIGLSCFHSLLPTNTAFFNANQNQFKFKSTPMVSFGIVVAASPGIRTLFHGCLLVVAGNTSHFVIDHHWHKAIGSGIKVLLLWFLQYRTVGASCLFVQLIPTAVASCLLLFVQSVA
jgi:hypothetical protein